MDAAPDTASQQWCFFMALHLLLGPQQNKAVAGEMPARRDREEVKLKTMRKLLALMALTLALAALVGCGKKEETPAATETTTTPTETTTMTDSTMADSSSMMATDSTAAH